MNGQDRKLFSKLSSDFISRFIQLETQFKERWDGHDKRSEGIWQALRGDMKIIQKKLDKLPQYAANIKSNTWSVRLLWGVIIVMGLMRGFFWMANGK